MRNSVFVIIAAFIVNSALISSCVNQTKQIKMDGLGEKIIIPSKLTIFNPFDNYTLDSGKIAKADLKLYVSIDFSCPTCVDRLNKWAELIPILACKKNIPFIVIGNSHDRFELLKYLVKKKMINRFPFPFFLDKDSVFFLQNKVIFESAGMNAVLTDKNNIILLYGDPINSPEVKSLFLKKINSL
ncbi:hypothetical protein ACQKCH_03170 [Nubsella zeaxanthinifaciens]|uniref:hypothetical protein n=1 Tax=Nubsella zeaxanthinifaciens TaxID=392412 RepID=UPI003CFC3BA0